MFLNKSQRSKRKKKSKERSERKKKQSTAAAKKERSQRSQRIRKARAERKEEAEKNATGTVMRAVSPGTSEGTTSGNGTTGGLPEPTDDKTSFEKKKKKEEPKQEPKAEPKPEPWTGEEVAKKMVASGLFNTEIINATFKELPTAKPPADECPRFKGNLDKIRAPDYPIPDEKLIKLTHAPDTFICAAKVSVPEFNRTMIVTQVPDVSQPSNIEDFWRMVFQEEIVSVVIAVMPLECRITLQQLFPISSGTFANHGKMFLNNKKVESAVAMTAYTLELLPDGCSNSLSTTVYHLHNWRQKRGLENVRELVTTMEKVVKTNENTLLMSMNGTGRAGTMLTIFTSMLHINKEKEIKVKEIVEKLRAERCGLVENAEQFGTAHKALALWFKTKSTDEEVQKKVQEYAPSLQ
ncbi:unnamed protein product [Caenorhabditis sp. 36 PRJEB53466]|nr:unnamed protein product [Caenorhabditis sp. 36 PRJEB53466]